MGAATTLGDSQTTSTHPRLHLLPKFGLALACVCAGLAPLAARGIQDDAQRIAVGVFLAAAYLAFSVFVRSRPILRSYWELPFAFFIFALVQVANNVIPGFFGSVVLRDPPT